MLCSAYWSVCRHHLVCFSTFRLDDKHRIEDFMAEILHDHLVEKCDVRRISPSLCRRHVVTKEQLRRMSLQCKISPSNKLFYTILSKKSKVSVLEKVSECFKNDTKHENNVKLGQYIDDFLASLRPGKCGF